MSEPTKRRRRDVNTTYAIVGAFTVVVLMIAVYVSYTANDGMPMVDTYDVEVEVLDANRMITNNDVRIAGVRVGQVGDVLAVPATQKKPAHSVLTLKLEKSVPQLSSDTRAVIRPASILGATYVDIVPGVSTTLMAEGDKIPLDGSEEVVELTDLIDIFDARTRASLQGAATSLGGGLVGRGAGAGRTLKAMGDAAPLVARVSRVLSDEQTRLAGLIRGYASAMRGFDAARRSIVPLLHAGATTATAMSAVGSDLNRTFDTLPEAATVATRALAQLRPALDDLAKVSTELRPAAELLPRALRELDATFVAGVRPTRLMPAFSSALGEAGEELHAFAKLETTDGALRKAEEMLVSSGGFLNVLTPAQVHCNVLTLMARGWFEGSGWGGEGDGPTNGLMFLKAPGSNILGTLQNKDPLPNLHANYIARANDQECEAGNEPFHDDRRVLSSPEGNQPRKTLVTKLDRVVRQRAESAGLLAAPPEGHR